MCVESADTEIGFVFSNRPNSASGFADWLRIFKWHFGGSVTGSSFGKNAVSSPQAGFVSQKPGQKVPQRAVPRGVRSVKTAQRGRRARTMLSLDGSPNKRPSRRERDSCRFDGRCPRFRSANQVPVAALDSAIRNTYSSKSFRSLWTKPCSTHSGTGQ